MKVRMNDCVYYCLVTIGDDAEFLCVCQIVGHIVGQIVDHDFWTFVSFDHLWTDVSLDYGKMVLNYISNSVPCCNFCVNVILKSMILSHSKKNQSRMIG